MTHLFFPNEPRSFAAWIPDAWTAWRIGGDEYRRLPDGQVQSRPSVDCPWRDLRVRPVRGSKAQVAA